MHRDVAQLGSALRSGRRGRRFKSCHPDHDAGKASKEAFFMFQADKEKMLLFTAGNERARKKHDVRISLLILHRVVSFLQL